MKVAIYARVSTTDRDQSVDNQLLPLREFVRAQGWEIYSEYFDEVPASDLAHRTGWRNLLDDASKRRFDMILVWSTDRAFRSMLEAATTLERLKIWGVSFRSYTQAGIDTSSSSGEALCCISAAWAEIEKNTHRERVKAGMDRARRQGRRIGRPRVSDRRGFVARFEEIVRWLSGNDISRRQAAHELGISYTSLTRLLNNRTRRDDAKTPGK